MKQFKTQIIQARLFATLAFGAANALLGCTGAVQGDDEDSVGNATDNLITQADAAKTYTFCANEWGSCKFSGTKVVRYGDVGHYVYKTFSNGAQCRNDAFGGDPNVGALDKQCAVESGTSTSTTPTAPTTTPAPTPATGTGKTYTQCATEWGTCSFSGSKVVRYGDVGHYVFKTFSNGTACTNTAFGGDPNVGALDKVCAIESDATGTTTAPVTTTPVTTTPVTTGGSTATRPTTSKGVGFFVSGGKLYDANGNEFRMRGLNKVHWQNVSPGITNTKSNTTRWLIDFTRRPSDNIAYLQGTTGGTIGNKQVVIPGNWDGTCQEDPSYLIKMVDTWVAQASSWAQIEKYTIINIANEWGPGDSTVWRDQYINAISRLRAAGYHATIQVTAGGCGQDAASIVKYGQAVFNSDPEKNVIFDQHVYGVYSDANGGAPAGYNGQPDLEAQLKALSATGLVVVVGEFGPGRNIGPSPTMVKPERVMQLAEKYNIGWLAWAWDDNDLDGGLSDDSWFSLSYTGDYKKSADLTIFGKTIVEHATLGLNVLAKPATIFK